MTAVGAVACEVRESVDVFEARRRLRVLCDRIGFSRHVSLELALVASELCTNILKYGVRGSIDMRRVHDPVHGVGVELVASDEGPQFHDLSSALRDGYDDRGRIGAAALIRRGGLGRGLGTVVRFTDSLRVEPESVGKRIVVRRYRRESQAGGVLDHPLVSPNQPAAPLAGSELAR
jgi:anti-sigma regulatory factor (Ser/Thr protein kinase)